MTEAEKMIQGMEEALKQEERALACAAQTLRRQSLDLFKQVADARKRPLVNRAFRMDEETFSQNEEEEEDECVEGATKVQDTEV